MLPELDFFEDSSPVDSDKFVFFLQKERRMSKIISDVIQKGINKTPLKIQSLLNNFVNKLTDEEISK